MTRYIIFAVMSIATFAAAMAMQSYTLGSGNTVTGTESMMIRSVYCINTASGADTNESAATLKMSTVNEYYKTIPWLLDPDGDFEVPEYLECKLYHGPYGGGKPNPYGMVKGRISRRNPDSASGDPNLYYGELHDAYYFPTNNAPEEDVLVSSNITTIISAYTDENNFNIHIDCIITNTAGDNIPRENVPCIRSSCTIPLDTYMYAYTNYMTYSAEDYPNERYIDFMFTKGTNNTYRTYTKALNRINLFKKEEFTIVTLSPGTASYAVTNGVDCLVPYGYKIYTETTSPFTKIGFTYE